MSSRWRRCSMSQWQRRLFSSCRPLLLPPLSNLPPSSQSSSLTLPLGLFTVDMVFFFLFLFPPPLQPANKSLALLLGLFFLAQRVLLVHTFSSKQTFYFNSGF